MKLFLLSTQLLLVLFKLQDAIHWPWLFVLIPMQIHGILIFIQFASAVILATRENLRRSALTPGERAAEDLARYYATHKSKF